MNAVRQSGRRGHHRGDLQRGHRGSGRHVRDRAAHAGADRAAAPRQGRSLSDHRGDDRGGQIGVGGPGLAAYRARSAYAGVAEHSVYVRAGGAGQRRGACRAGRTLGRAYAESGFWKIVSRIFPEKTTGSLRLHERCGFRVVGVYPPPRQAGRAVARLRHRGTHRGALRRQLVTSSTSSRLPAPGD